MNKRIVYIVLSLISLTLFWNSKETGIFWDNVIFAGKMGNHLYNNGLFSWNFPNSFDPGHPPFLAFILASGWNFFGKSLFISHLVLVPFVFGLLIQIYKLCEHYFNEPKYLILTFALIISEPTLTSHLLIINPEILILFFFFLAVNSFLRKNHWLKIIALAFLGVTSLRGMLLCGGFFLYEISILFLNKELLNRTSVKRIIRDYSIAAIPAILFIAGRLYFKGWISSHPDFPWLEFREIVNFKEFLRNIVVLSHRYLDFGKVSIFIFLIIVIIKTKILNDKKNIQLLALAIIPTLTIIITSLREVNPMGHRYFMISFTGFIMLAMYILSQQVWKNRMIIYAFLSLSLISGNLWIYPKHIAQGWDASLAHLPYYTLRKQAINYIDKNNIPITEITTFSPNATKIDNVDLNNDNREFLPFDNQSKYVLNSTVYNLNDEEIISINDNYQLLKSFKKNRIEVEILVRN